MTRRDTAVVIVGMGAAGREHLRGWNLIGHRVVGICDSDVARLAEFARAGVTTDTDLRSLLEKTEAGVVDICTPHHLHVAQLLSLADWPGAVVVEKPLADRDSDLAPALAFISGRTEGFVMRTNKRFEQHSQYLASLLHPAVSLDAAVAVHWQQRPAYMLARPWYSSAPASRGGVVLGMGIHYFDLLESLCGPIEVMSADLRSHEWPHAMGKPDVENYALVELRCDSGWTATLTLSCHEELPDLPIERVDVMLGSRKLTLERARDEAVRAESLRQEFAYYANVLACKGIHPPTSCILASHRAAYACYAKEGGGNG